VSASIPWQLDSFPPQEAWPELSKHPNLRRLCMHTDKKENHAAYMQLNHSSIKAQLEMNPPKVGLNCSLRSQSDLTYSSLVGDAILTSNPNFLRELATNYDIDWTLRHYDVRYSHINDRRLDCRTKLSYLEIILSSPSAPMCVHH